MYNFRKFRNYNEKVVKLQGPFLIGKNICLLDFSLLQSNLVVVNTVITNKIYFLRDFLILVYKFSVITNKFTNITKI